ncbi:MAG TPA: phosphoribosylformylglycinamidine synthase subunit PurL [Planctomycetota bacterium]|nr:phosphoribosylformylglycinamidine synthase subunit PurL [Planctomycetota bacterium]
MKTTSKAPSVPDKSPAAHSTEVTASAAWRLEVFRQAQMDDPEGSHLLRSLPEFHINSISAARLGRGVLLPPDLERETVEAIARELLVDPVLDELRLYAPDEAPPATPAGTARLLVTRKSGVMDPVAGTIARTLARTGLTAGEQVFVATFAAWELTGTPTEQELLTIGRRILANVTIEELLLSREDLPYGAPRPAAGHGRVEVPLAELDDQALLAISTDGGLSLSLDEMRAIAEHFAGLGRAPSACELETLAQTWSEHCKHKTFAGRVEMVENGETRLIDNLFKETIRAATEQLDKPWCVSVFHDNAGIVRFEGDWDLAFKVETHNHPSAIDPYGGAGTGIGGVVRDILGVGLGARPIANTDAFFVGPPELPREDVPTGCMHPRRILRGVVAGVRDYGNRMGIPTVSGGVWFHEGYTANPLVYAGTVGLIPAGLADKSVAPGDAILAVGGRTGRDGIHGATFSSVELHEESETTSSSAVQIGDPIMEKRVLDGLLRARDRGLYRGVTDCGAGGFSSAVGEMGEACGARVELDKVPLKYPGLTPEEVWISEAQERMVLAVPPDKLAACIAVFEAEDVEAAVIGEFTDSGQLVLQSGGECMADISMEFLHGGVPGPLRRGEWTLPAALAETRVPAPRDGDHAAVLLALLASPDIASKEWIVRQYDHEVQGMSVLKPLVGPRGDGPGDGAVLQPLAESRRGVAIAVGACPRFGLLDPYAMATAAIDEALRNVVCAGGDPAQTAILDNFSWGNCDKPDRLGALVLAAEACRDAALAYGTPFISGKDSLNNEYRVAGQSLAIPPTLLISAMAPVPDVSRVTSMDLKAAGNHLLLLGSTAAELGGSHYFNLCQFHTGRPPRADLATAPRLLSALHSVLAAGLVRSAHDLAEGGLAVAAAEMAFAGELGLDLDIAGIPVAEAANQDGDTLRLYSESCTRFLLEVAPEELAAVTARLADFTLTDLGRVTSDRRLVLRSQDRQLLACALDDLRRAHGSAFQG